MQSSAGVLLVIQTRVNSGLVLRTEARTNVTVNIKLDIRVIRPDDQVDCCGKIFEE